MEHCGNAPAFDNTPAINIVFRVNISTGELIYLSIYTNKKQAIIALSGEGAIRRWQWTMMHYGDRDFVELLVRILYVLGFEKEQAFARLPPRLSMHEQMELRLSLPREFWPNMWLDEEAP